MRKVADRVLICFVILFLLIPLVTFNFAKNQKSVIENRNLAELADVRSGYTKFRKSLLAYVNDRIGGRDYFLKTYDIVMYKYLHHKHKKVIPGKDGWLFYFEGLPDYTGENQNAALVEQEVRILKKLDQRCKDMGIIFVYEVCPNKSTIYSEYMPDYIYHTPISQTDRLIARLKDEGIKICYPKQELLDHHMEDELYMKLDTHWNVKGAGYLFDEFTDLLHLQKRDFPMNPSFSSSGDLRNMVGVSLDDAQSKVFSIENNKDARINIHEREATIENPDGIKFVVYRDSFTSNLLPYYQYYFTGPVHWKYKIDFDELEKEKPKVVILECVERYVRNSIFDNQDVLKTK